ncbi:structural maintenance of chromosome protein 3 [Fomitiporia mediterranea MF3/22]|uniref:structural maintenance of chromosome protein 3 n=1 Tax=Fomitiporia mediterranea (strain MF3/22) TaxID=694068 RepID=UPI00044084A1|nr:structural maintenance of chromosome protein 3 [Fomitiporia mediterranea MF3/22]EJD00759.1 structural maintenance of chromosome protein 3 [Fomitiporia mediterranea MF3/22]
MHIQTLTIQGFKSYRDRTEIEPFSPGHNVVVGRNGSGKSNFFAAIRFVLGDAYSSMSREERQALLHEGVSVTSTLSAYVEIVFTNQPARFPTPNPTVTIRRTIGLKKDEYTLDKKSASKADVMSLLESAGFSRANPYYIVPQGRITALTNAKDHERLALLKEVAGTKVYEQRRTESLRIMDETSSKRQKISELLDYIDGRLNELEEEKEELKEYQEKDRERRCLEYALFERELQEVTGALEELEDERRGEVHGVNVRREAFNEREKEIQALEEEIKQTKHSTTTLSLSKHGFTSEINDLIRSRTELECNIEDLQAAKERAGGKREELEAELEEVNAKIAEKEHTLQALNPRWDEHRAREAEERLRLDEARAHLEMLYEKQGRLSRFRSRAERDQFLSAEIASLRAYKDKQSVNLRAAERDLLASRDALAALSKKSEDVQGRLEDRRDKGRELSEELSKVKDKHAELLEKRKELWREDARLTSTTGHAENELRQHERDLASMMDKDTGAGLRSVERIAERHGLRGVYGPLYKLFEVTDKKFNTAVELTAGSSLFHVVVDTDETASRVLDIMLKEKTGRVTFMPLNRLKPKDVAYPNAPDAIPLINKLRFDPIHEKAFKQVFGKTCVCRDLFIAAAYVRSHNLNTITLDGDKVDRKGSLTGGYHDVRRSRIDTIRSVQSWREKYDSDKATLAEVKRGIVVIEQEITQLVGRIQVLTTQREKLQNSRDPLVEEATSLTREHERLRDRISKGEQDVDELQAELAGLQVKINDQEQEMKTPMARGLSPEEEMTIARLTKQVEARQATLVQLGKAKSELGSQKNLLEIELNESLRRRREELQAKLESLGEADSGAAFSADDYDARVRELKALNKSIPTLSDKCKDMDKESDKLSVKLQELRTKLEEMQNQQSEDSKGISRQQKNTERYIAKKQMLINRKDDCNRNIRDLGVLPEEAFEKYTNDKLDRLVKKLHTVNEGLKKFAHVNKKAFEQYNNFTKQRDQLLSRREELDKSAKSIEELIQVLDMRKDEAIERTFKQVAKNFEEVFEKLVPAGKGRLIIQRRIDQDEDDMEEDEDTQRSSVDNYTGVSIKVSFNSKVDEGLRIQQLSGGQKSLVALATVFAIQKCDPAPFYLFDEIDANLDAQYRTAVASMIHELSASAQFITTTFRPEMLVTADKFYGVTFNNQKVSSIRSIRREEAQEFVDQVRLDAK